ncbi:uncharacterized protein Triagg1_4642 [Trichoderma aggressivum f. europaeum]|uniref:Uncharacterized protein n=1 Tax=Trichoderma aggressivum f. europaeum TaxID=173218 RepID=A0AAE1IF96_9HYPO|nr:hypothetical protein Triagg1_4642 [Trichoderma aggressivum f. europaeum]
MEAHEEKQLCTKLMRALFSVFVGNPNINMDCFNECVEECYFTDVLSAGSLSQWQGYRALYKSLAKSQAETRRKIGDGVYVCPKAAILMSGLACLCIHGVPGKVSVILRAMLRLKVIEHARTVVIHNRRKLSRQGFLWINRGRLSSPEEKDGDEIESSADHCNTTADDDSNIGDNEGGGADIGSGTTDTGSGGADNDSGS